MDAILNLDFDFFTQPTYIGSYYGDKEWNSFSDFQSKAKLWLTAEEFFSKLGIDSPIRGGSSTENINAFHEVKKAFTRGAVEKGKVELVQFDAHPNTYYWHSKGVVDNWNINDYRSYNSSIAYFKEKLVDSITWVVPDYMNGDLLNKHFNNFEVLRDQNIIIPVVSSSFIVRLKMVRWSDFIKRAKNYNWKIMSFVTNNRMCVYDHEQLHVILKNIRKY